MTDQEVIKLIKQTATSKNKEMQKYFAIGNNNSLGLKVPQMRAIAKQIGRNHKLALQLWKSGIHEAKHIAVMIADPKEITEKFMEHWLKDFDSWDIVDNCCTLFEKSPLAWEKAIEWTSRKGEFQKRAGFTLMATLAVHDKKAKNENFEQFFPLLLRESHDERNFVKKAINWAIRQIGKRNEKLCKKAIVLSEKIQMKGDSTSRWIAADALRELRRYQAEGKIKNIGGKLFVVSC
jgi:3-methyladenine DNA glycosylase AlkD